MRLKCALNESFSGMPFDNRSKRITLTVLAPAMMPPTGNTMAPLPTPYAKDSPVGMNTPVGVPPAIGQATVTGGVAVDGEWYSCTYAAGPFVIPGMSKVSIEAID